MAISELSRLGARYQTAEPEQAIQGNQEIVQSLERVATLRKVALKVTAAACCPLSFACLSAAGCCLNIIDCCSIFGCCEPCSGGHGRLCKFEDEGGNPYCSCSTCRSPCWNPAPLPKNGWEMAQLGCDPFVFCCYCSEGTADNYLTAPERQQMELAQPQVGAARAQQPLMYHRVFPKPYSGPTYHPAPSSSSSEPPFGGAWSGRF